MSEQCDISYQGRPPDMEIYKKTQWYSNGILTDTQGGNVYGTSVDHPACSNIQKYGNQTNGAFVGCIDNDTCTDKSAGTKVYYVADNVNTTTVQDQVNNSSNKYHGLVCSIDNGTTAIDCCGKNTLGQDPIGLIVTNETDFSKTNHLGNFLCKYPPAGYKYECVKQDQYIDRCQLSDQGTYTTKEDCESHPTSSCSVKSYNIVPGDGHKLGPYCKEYDVSTAVYASLADCEASQSAWAHSCPHVTGYYKIPVQDCKGGLNVSNYINDGDWCTTSDTSYNACAKLKPGRGRFKFKEYCGSSSGPPTHTVCECDDTVCINKCVKKGDVAKDTIWSPQDQRTCCSGNTEIVPFVGLTCT